MEKDMEKEEKVARRRNELRKELKSLELLNRALSEFGLEYLKSEETSRTPHPMSELDQFLAGMKLTPRDLFRMGDESYDFVGPFMDIPFNFRAKYFAYSDNRLVSINDDNDLYYYTVEILNSGEDDGFIDWLDHNGLVGEKWVARAELYQKVTLSIFCEELETLLCAVDDALEKVKEEARMGGCAGAAARRLAPKYHEMLGKLNKTRDDALRARDGNDLNSLRNKLLDGDTQEFENDTE